METIFLTATPEEQGRRLDQFLAEALLTWTVEGREAAELLPILEKLL